MKKALIAILVLLVICIGAGTWIYFNSMEPVNAAESKAVELAKKETDLTEIEDFHLYHGTETYYVIEGKDAEGTNIFVWVPEKNGKIVTRRQSDGISSKEAINRLKQEKNPAEIMSVRLGMEKNIPLWEIHYRSKGDLINYYYIDFKTGEWLKKIENL
ncbi:cell wall elongation regulator TseB-like domain-containing protein [Cytobacillus oceanisediminis]|uniref:cell wall elongation regulator TseB-like domain-containing protein n=1 Tax=Cytobacillus oceanisediminis TaxID=665099 RepID=UPI003737065D